MIRDFTLRFNNLKKTRIILKLNKRGERALLKAVYQDIRALLIALLILSKSEFKLCKNTIRKVLKYYEQARYKARKKPYLLKIHKRARNK